MTKRTLQENFELYAAETKVRQLVEAQTDAVLKKRSDELLNRLTLREFTKDEYLELVHITQLQHNKQYWEMHCKVQWILSQAIKFDLGWNDEFDIHAFIKGSNF